MNSEGGDETVERGEGVDYTVSTATQDIGDMVRTLREAKAKFEGSRRRLFEALDKPKDGADLGDIDGVLVCANDPIWGSAARPVILFAPGVLGGLGAKKGDVVLGGVEVVETAALPVRREDATDRDPER